LTAIRALFKEASASDAEFHPPSAPNDERHDPIAGPPD
jgi:hypothetical protein